MSNPQINILKAQGTLNQVEDDIIKILKRYATAEEPLCSHEILGLANSDTIMAIGNGIKPGGGGFSVPSSWIGSVAADLANHNQIIRKDKPCKFSGHEEAWYIP